MIMVILPYRYSRHIHLGYPNEYYAFKNVKKFYDDILEALKDSKLMKSFIKENEKRKS